MKSIIKIFLLTVLTCCYVNTVFEFAESEKKANFENESHYYTHNDNNDLIIPIAKTVQHFDIAFDYLHQLNFSANCKDNKCKHFYYKYFKPPDRLFLLNTSLLFYG